jgi:methionyl-tRNA synthetase
VHVIGKGIVRFHAVYWLALLLSTGQPLPDAIFVHEYLTVDKAKLSKTTGNAVDPVDLVERYGNDALRWWLLREVASLGDTDFTEERLRTRYHHDLANDLGNLINRTVSLIHKYRHGTVGDQTPTVNVGSDLIHLCAGLPTNIDRALAAFDLRAATDAIWVVVAAANRLVEAERPWELARREQAGDDVAGERLDAVLTRLITSCRTLTHELTPLLPTGSAKLATQLGKGRLVATPQPVFPRLDP